MSRFKRVIDPVQQRKAAECVLRNPGKFPTFTVRWAERMLAEQTEPANETEQKLGAQLGLGLEPEIK